jgi:hypothetical protein
MRRQQAHLVKILWKRNDAEVANMLKSWFIGCELDAQYEALKLGL